MTAQTSKPRASRSMAPPRRVPGKHNKQPRPQRSNNGHRAVPPQPRMSEVSYDPYSSQMNDEDRIEQATISSESESNFPGNVRWPTASRKRKRGQEQVQQPPQMSPDDQQHLIWSDELLDYFMLQRSDDPPPPPPNPPDNINLNRPVDEKGNTALHWAAAMGDLNLVQNFIQRGADVNVLTNQGATPLIHAVTFTNNWDKGTMGRLTEVLYSTVGQRDCCASTVFHHIAASTMSKSKYPIARYYLEQLLDKLKQAYEPRDIGHLLDLQDENGNTAVLLAAKNGARKCVRLMTAEGARVDIPNVQGETAEQFIKQLNERRRDRQRQVSSSPVLPPSEAPLMENNTTRFPELSLSQTKASQYASEAAAALASQLPTLIQSRTEQLASAFENELTERESDAREGERLLELRKQELSVVRKQLMSFSAQSNSNDADGREQVELELVERQTNALLHSERDSDMGRQVKRLKHTHDTAQNEPKDAVRAWNVAEYGRQAMYHQRQSVALLDNVVVAQGFAGVGNEKHAAYKQLIMTALGVRNDDVEPMLNDILDELEAAKGDAPEGNGDTSAQRIEGVGLSEDGATAQVRMAMPASGLAQNTGNVVYTPVQVAG